MIERKRGKAEKEKEEKRKLAHTQLVERASGLRKINKRGRQGKIKRNEEMLSYYKCSQERRGLLHKFLPPRSPSPPPHSLH